MRGTQSSRFGRQPALRVMKRQRWTTAAAARELGMDYANLYHVLIGRVTPSPHVRNGLSRLLDAPLEDLFTADALAAQFQLHVPRSSRRKRGAR